MEISINFSNLKNLKITPTLFFEFHGSEKSNIESVNSVSELCDDNNGFDFDFSSDLKKRNELWKARHDVYWSVKSLKPNARVYATDACVPITNLVECIKFTENEIIMSLGPAGTGKSFLAVSVGVAMLMEKKVERVILSRPAVEAGEKLGFLPGDLKEKVDPYLRPLYDSLYDLMPSDIAIRKIESAEIEIAPLAFMRGRTLNNSFVILDEAQNATHTQIKMFLTRCGKNSRMVVTGDPSQIDLNRKSDSGLLKSIKILEKIDNIEVVELGSKDIVRDEMVTKIINAYDSYDDQIKDLFDQKS